MQKTVFLFAILFHVLCLKAQDTLLPDSTSKDFLLTTPDSIQDASHSFMRTELARRSIAPLLLFSTAAATWGRREQIRDIRNRYLPSFLQG